MKKGFPRSHFFTYDDLPLLQLSHTFMESSIWLEKGMDKFIATFDLFVRDMPANRNYLVFGGLEEMVHWLTHIKFNAKEIAFLLKHKLISRELAPRLKKFKFTGDVWAMKEGTVFFPGEPVVRVTAPLIEAAMIEAFMFTALSSNTMFFSKAARIRSATEGKYKISTGPIRGHSFESGMKASRAGYVFGIESNGNPSVYRKYGIPVTQGYIVNAQHLFIKSFHDEISAFRAFFNSNFDKLSFMLDTYDFKKGLERVIQIAKEFKSKGKSLYGIQVDSGNISELCRYARKRLDKEGFKETNIIVASNLDEKKIATMARRNIPCDRVVSATEYMTLSDSPKLEAVYKLSEIRDGKTIRYTAKFAPGKVSYPGRKQVFRSFKKGKFVVDHVGLENEKLGTPLLELVVKKGKLLKRLPSLEEIREYAFGQLKKLPPPLLNVFKTATYKVSFSPKLESLLNKVRKAHSNM